MYNPITDAVSKSSDPVSVSALMNDVIGQCPKCKNTFEDALVDGTTVFYCPNCRVAAPTPDNVVG